MSEFVDDAGDGRDWSVSRQVTVVAIMALMIVALGAVALKGGSGRADTSGPLTPGDAAAGPGAVGPGVAVPSVVGLTQAEATKVLANAGFKSTISVSRADDKVGLGKIANQVPGAGKKAVKGSVVQLALSLGPTQTSVPRLVGYPTEGALTLLQRAGLGFTASGEISDRPAGTILRQSPAPGTKRPRGTKVALVISNGSWLVPGETVPPQAPAADATIVYWVPQTAPARPAAPLVAAGGGTTSSSHHGASMGGGTRPATTQPPTTRPPTTHPPVTLRPYPTSPPTTCISRPLPGGSLSHFCW